VRKEIGNKMVICRTCEDRGLKNGCPTCGKVLGLQRKTVTVTAEVLDSKNIPNEYLGVVWEAQKLKNNHQELIENNRFKYYVDQLTKMTEMFNSGKIPNQSAIIIAPRAMSKVTFAYSCMQLAMEHGYTVCPLLDNTQVKRINNLSADNPSNWITRGLPSIEEIITSDVLFLTVDMDNYATALRTIESVIEKRARCNKSTFIITRFPIERMCQFEKKNSYSSLFDRTRSFNNKKYPVIIDCNV
jgi:hypothetical protein